MDPILKLGAFELAEKIKSRNLSVEKVVQTFIHQAQSWQKTTNAIVEDFFSPALDEARKKDAFLKTNPAGEKLPPLFGVPFSCKEMIAIEGAKRTAGNIYFKDRVSLETATVVHRAREAGAILVATTNVPELGFWFETDNVVYGRTNNPYDPTRTSGGSSGGEAALIASRGSAFGIGSDIGGSIRIPAFFCGLFAHKPSARTLPLTGHFPFTESDMKELAEPFYPYTTYGVMSYKAKDLHGLIKILRGPDGLDPATRSDVTLKNLVDDVSGVKVFSLPHPKFFMASRTHKDLQKAVDQATRYLAQIGCQVEEFPEDFFVPAVELWFKALKRTKKHSFAEAMNPHTSLDLKKEFLNLLTSKANHTFPSLTTAVLEKLAFVQADQEDSMESIRTMRKQLSDFLGTKAVLILPPHPRPAPKHRAVWLTPFDFIFGGIFNILEGPATVAPLGVNDQDLPLGVQIVGSYGEDHLTISVAAALESAFGGSISVPEI